MINSRRKFIRQSAALTAAGLVGNLGQWGVRAASAQATGDYKALVCIFLFGGNDSNNMVIPITTPSQQYAQYAAVRTNIAIPQAQLLSIPTPSGAVYGLHPNLAAIQPLWTQKKLGVVANVGPIVKPTTRTQYLNNQVTVPSNLFSHSDQTSEWQTAAPLGGTTGWGGRIGDRLAVYGSNSPSSYPAGTSVSGGALLLNGAN